MARKQKKMPSRYASAMQKIREALVAEASRALCPTSGESFDRAAK